MVLGQWMAAAVAAAIIQLALEVSVFQTVCWVARPGILRSSSSSSSNNLVISTITITTKEEYTTTGNRRW
uniref:Putative secreted protein n=1 Tax=Anopheles darlingi TaxID=43151 RepID=A0A2M4DHZ4_ANODA